MPRPTAAEAARLKKAMKAHVDNGLSVNQIARLTGKAQQTVHEYLVKHGLYTRGMKKRKGKTLDRVKATSDNGGGNKETSHE